MYYDFDFSYNVLGAIQMSDITHSAQRHKDVYAEQNRAALQELYAWCGSSWAQVARVLGVHYQAVMGFKSKGRIGARTAARAGRSKKVPFTREQLRPDIKDWTVWEKKR